MPGVTKGDWLLSPNQFPGLTGHWVVPFSCPILSSEYAKSFYQSAEIYPATSCWVRTWVPDNLVVDGATQSAIPFPAHTTCLLLSFLFFFINCLHQINKTCRKQVYCPPPGCPRGPLPLQTRNSREWQFLSQYPLGSYCLTQSSC